MTKQIKRTGKIPAKTENFVMKIMTEVTHRYHQNSFESDMPYAVQMLILSQMTLCLLASCIISQWCTVQKPEAYRVPKTWYTSAWSLLWELSGMWKYSCSCKYVGENLPWMKSDPVFKLKLFCKCKSSAHLRGYRVGYVAWAYFSLYSWGFIFIF